MRRYALAAALAAVVLLPGTALAQPADQPVSGDGRATAHSGNVVGKDCAELFPGSSQIAAGDLTSSVDGTNTYVDITVVADGVEVAGVIVKGGPAYNVYQPADLGALPWLDLHSPLVPSGKPAQISHWFACGVTESTTTTTTTGEVGGTSTTTSTETSTSSESSTASSESSSSAVSVTTTTSAAVAPAAEEGDLASTGFNGGWLIGLAAALLLGGGALLLLVRRRAARN
jgi:hypothetical protein